MEVGIRVDSENIRDGSRRQANSSYFTMVAVDEAGTPVPVPTLTPVTDIEHERFGAARARREALRTAFPR